MTTAIILAGGLGTRLREVCPNLPKPMAPINDKPFLAYQLDYWVEQGITHFILSVGYKAQAIIDFFGASYKGIKITYVQENTPLGTGGGLLLAAQSLNNESAFLLLNGDTYFAVDLKQLVDFANQNQADWCFALFSSEDRERYLGMSVLPSGQITSLTPKQESITSLVNGGVYWIKTRALADFNDSSQEKLSLENDLLPKALSSGQRLFGLPFLKTFIDIGIPKDYHRALSVIEKASEFQVHA